MSTKESPRNAVRTIFIGLALLFSTAAYAGELVFPPADHGATCQAGIARNPESCNVGVQMGGGNFVDSPTLGHTVYATRASTCDNPWVTFTLYPATDVEIKISNGSYVTGQQIKLQYTEADNPNVLVTKPLIAFPTGEVTTISLAGTSINWMLFTIVNDHGYPETSGEWAVISMSATQPVYPTVDLAVIRNGSGYSAVIKYAFPAQSTSAAGRSLTLATLPAGKQPSVTILSQTGLDASGTIVQSLPSFDTDRTLRATASACAGTKTADASISCTHCKGPATSVGGPVRLFDGVMTYADTDPLPSTIGSEFRREYSSGTPVDGVFGLGWTSLFDASAVPTDADNKSVSVVNENRTRATFRLLSTGEWAQTWPVGGVAGTLTGAEASGYTYRDAGGSIVRTFGANHQLTRLQNLRTGRAVSITYDGAGNPTAIADETGNWSCTITTANGHITTIAVDGRPDLTWTYAYTGSLLTSVTVAGSASPWRTYEYTSNRMTAIRDAGGAIIERHDYDADGRATSSYDPSGDITNIQYPASDAGGVATTSVTRADNSQATYQQTFSAGAVVTQQADGGCSSCGSGDATAAYDTKGNLWRLQNGRGYVTESFYDYAGRHLITSTTALAPSGCNPVTDAGHCRLSSTALATATLDRTTASLTTNYEYADFNWPAKPTQIARDSVLFSGGSAIESFTFDPVTGDALTHTVSGYVDAAGTPETHLATTALYNGTEGAAFNPGGAFQAAWMSLAQPSGEKKSADGLRTDVSDVTTFVYYPADASVPGSWRRRLAAVRNAAGHVTRYENYDAFGHAATVTDANGVVTRFTFDALGRLVTSAIAGVAGCDTAADPLCGATDLTTTRTYTAGGGELASEQRPAGNVTSYAYDTRGRLQTLTRGTATTPLERIDYTYDPTSGKKATETISGWQNNAWVVTKSESYTYTSDGQLSSVVHPDNTRAQYAYLPDGTLSSVQDENHAAPNTAYGYDPANRLATVTQTLTGAPGGQIVTRYGYDLQGNLTSVTDPNGNVTTYVYDDFARLQRQTSPVSGATTYAYDAAGDVLTTTDANGATTTRAYDALGRVTSSSATRDSATEAVTWSYDDATAGRFGIGRAASVAEPTGSTAYQYERRGMLRVEAKTIAGATYTTSYGYDANGNRARLTYPSGLVAQYTSDFGDRPYSLTAGATNIVTSASYLPFGPLTAIAFGNGTARTMRYDARYRPLENKLTGPSGTLADYNYAEDNVGNITQLHDATAATYNRDFGYDDLNRLVTANSGVALWGAGNYAYDAMGNMTSSALGTWKTTSATLAGTTPKLNSVVENGSSRAVTYDAAGNETAVGLSTYAYSPRNSLVSADTSAYVYDGRGLLTMAMYSVLSANVAPSTLAGGTAATGAVTLSAPAAADTTVLLSSSNSGVASVPPSVTVPAGQTSASFAVTTSPVAATSTATITAAFNQYTTTSLVTVLPAQLASLAIAPSTIIGGSPATGTVTLSGPAAATFVVSLSSNSAAATVPPSVTVPAGSSSGTFTITTTSGVVNTTATITATAGTASQQATLTFAADLASLSITPASVTNGSGANGTITLTDPAGAPITISLSSSSSDAYPNVSPVTIQTGGTSAGFTISTNLQSPTPKTVTFTATHGSVTRQATLTVNPPAITALSIAPSTITAGDSPANATGTATLNGPATNGYTATMSSTNTSLIATPQPVMFGSGATSGQTPVLTNPVLSTTPVVVTATDPNGIARSQTVTLQPAAITLSNLTLSSGTVIGSNSVTGTVTLTAAAPSPGIDVDLQTTDAYFANPGVLVHVATGSTTATFSIKTTFALTNTSVTISAIHAATTKTATLSVTKPSAANYVACCELPNGSPNIVTGGTTITATVGLGANATSNTTVTLTSNNSSVVSVPASVTIKKGARQITFTITTTSVTAAKSAIITATAGGVTFTLGEVLVLPSNGLGMLTGGFDIPAAASGTSFYRQAVTLTAPAPVGGVTVSFTGSRANVITLLGASAQGGYTSPNTIYIQQGSTFGIVFVQTAPFTGIKRGTRMTFTLGSITRTFDFTITPQAQASLSRPETVQCASLSLAPCLAALPRAATNAGDPSGYTLYTAELQLLAETQVTTATSKPIAYSYLWFGGQPVAVVDAAANATRWYATDHLGTPFLLTDASGAVAWRAEYTPYGDVFATRAGASQHQPLRLPGQVAQDGNNLYNNVFRWYRSGWGRYTQADPLGLENRVNIFEYTRESPLRSVDPLGLWEIGKYPGDGESTVVCDGEGNMKPWYGPTWAATREDQKCLEGCAKLHETSHINDINKVKPGICKGQSLNLRVNSSSIAERNTSEVMAYRVEYSCLKHSRARNGCCKDSIERRMHYIDEILIWDFGGYIAFE